MKILKPLLVLFALIILIPLFGYFLWVIQKSDTMDIMIVNKTVEKVSKNEMRSLNWVLNYNKIVKSSSNPYNYEKDYFGYHPEPVYEGQYIQSFKLKDIATLKDQYEALIYLDNEGVKLVDPVKSKNSYYGGFNQSDYLLLKEMSKAGKMIIAEYNFFSEPTEDLVRFNTEQFLDVYSVHWRGKYFNNLDKKKIVEDIGQHWITDYKDISGEEWLYSGPGIVLINDKQSRILVFPADEYMTEEFPSIETNSDLASFFKVKESLPYTGWFQIVYEGKNEVISNFNLNLNEEAVKILMGSGLEGKFPATIALNNPHQYFFAGDYSKQWVFLSCSKVRIVSDLIHIICRAMAKNPGQFFHNYYLPLTSVILENYQSSLNNVEDSE